MTIRKEKFRPIRLLLPLLISVILIAGCGQRRIELVPPGFSLAEMSVLPQNSAIDIQLRLENRSEVGMEIQSLELALEIDAITMNTRIIKKPRSVATLSREIVVLAADYDSELISALDKLNSGERSRLSLVISGTLITESGRELSIDEQLWISATPGKPGYFR